MDAYQWSAIIAVSAIIVGLFGYVLVLVVRDFFSE